MALSTCPLLCNHRRCHPSPELFDVPTPKRCPRDTNSLPVSGDRHPISRLHAPGSSRCLLSVGPRSLCPSRAARFTGHNVLWVHPHCSQRQHSRPVYGRVVLHGPRVHLVFILPSVGATRAAPALGCCKRRCREQGRRGPARRELPLITNLCVQSTRCCLPLPLVFFFSWNFWKTQKNPQQRIEKSLIFMVHISTISYLCYPKFEKFVQTEEEFKQV